MIFFLHILRQCTFALLFGKLAHSLVPGRTSSSVRPISEKLAAGFPEASPLGPKVEVGQVRPSLLYFGPIHHVHPTSQFRYSLYIYFLRFVFLR